MQQYKGIIFDFDGVILDSVDVKTKAFATMYASYGEEIVEQVVQYHLAHGGISRFDKFKYYSNNLLHEKLSDEASVQLGEQFNQLVFDKVIAADFIPGALSFLQKVQQQLPLFICTGTPETEINLILKARKLDSYFTKVYGSPKKKKEIVAEIKNLLNCSSPELLYFGDAMTDYEAAMHHQIDFIGVIHADNPFPKGTKVIHAFDEIEA